MPIVDINGFSMYYFEGGAGQPVAFVHGGFASFSRTLRDPEEYEWDEWENDFARTFRFITYHRRGCELSSCPDGGFDPATQASDLAALLDHLGLEAAHIVGSSAGGPISIEYAAGYPERTKSLTLVGTGLDLFRDATEYDEDLKIIREQLKRLDELGAEAAFRERPAGIDTSFDPLLMGAEMEQRGEFDAFQKREAELARRASEKPIAERARYYAAELRNIEGYMRWDGRSAARSIKAPTLILHGEHDRAIPLAWGRELADTIPDARFQMMAGASHGLLWRSTEARRTAIRFIREQPS